MPRPQPESALAPATLGRAVERSQQRLAPDVGLDVEQVGQPVDQGVDGPFVQTQQHAMGGQHRQRALHRLEDEHQDLGPGRLVVDDRTAAPFVGDTEARSRSGDARRRA